MTLQDLSNYRQQLRTTNTTFYADLFSDDIWGDMGVDTASITIQATSNDWQLHYVRTQSGIPYIFGDYVSTIVDEYEKQLSDEEFFAYLGLHNLQQVFQTFVKNNT